MCSDFISDICNLIFRVTYTMQCIYMHSVVQKLRKGNLPNFTFSGPCCCNFCDVNISYTIQNFFKFLVHFSTLCPRFDSLSCCQLWIELIITLAQRIKFF